MKSYIGGRTHGGFRSLGRVHGSGMGSMLLHTPAGGSGSSYMSMDDYKATTGAKVKGEGFLGGKLDQLLVKPLERKKVKNIRF